MSADSLDLDKRELCPDGCCVGVIGADGRCGECGLSRDASAAEVDEASEPPPTSTPAPHSPPEGDADVGLAADDDEEGHDLESRVPCSDDTCVGIIGPDGRCGTCGLGEAPTADL